MALVAPSTFQAKFSVTVMHKCHSISFIMCSISNFCLDGGGILSVNLRLQKNKAMNRKMASFGHLNGRCYDQVNIIR